MNRAKALSIVIRSADVATHDLFSPFDLYPFFLPLLPTAMQETTSSYS